MNFSLSLYNKTWDSPTLINLTNLTRGVRYCQVPNPFLVSGSGAEKAPIMNYCSFGRCVFLFFNMLSPGGGDGAGNPADIVLPTLLATAASTVCGVGICRLLAGWSA